MPKKSEAVDVQIRHCGSVVMFALLTKKSLAWIEENVSLESWQWMGNAFAVDPRYVVNLAEGMRADGLIVV